MRKNYFCLDLRPVHHTEKRDSYLWISAFPECPQTEKDLLNVETVWYQPKYRAIFVKNFDTLYTFAGDKYGYYFIDLPSASHIPDHLEYIGVL